MFSLSDAYGMNQDGSTQPVTNTFNPNPTQVQDNASSVPTDNIWSNIANSPVGQAVGNVIGDVGNVLSTPQRALFQVAAPVVSGITGRQAPNFFDYSQNPGAQMDKLVTGQNNFLADLGFGLIDPLMLLTGPEGDIAKAITEGGKEVGLAKESVPLMQDLAKTWYGAKDLTDVANLPKGGDLIQGLRNEIAKTNPELTKPLGIKFGGLPVVSNEQLKSVGNTIGSAANSVKDTITNLPPVQKFLNSDTGQALQDGMNTLGHRVQQLFNARETNEGPLTKAEFQVTQDLNGAKNIASQRAQNLVASLFKDFTAPEGQQFYDLAKLGVPTNEGLMSAKQLAGKSLDELKQIAPNVSEKVLGWYHQYINQVEPELRQIAKDEFGFKTDNEAENYIHDMLTSKQTRGQKFGAAPMQSKILDKSGSMKQKVMSAGLNAEQAAAKGFETDPRINVGRLAYDRYYAQERNAVLHNMLQDPTLAHQVTSSDLTNPSAETKDAAEQWLRNRGFTQNEAGKWVSSKGKSINLQNAIDFFKEMKDENGNPIHGIYQPQGNLRFYKDVSGGVGISKNVPTYLTSRPLASRLNELRVGDSWKTGLGELARSTSNGLLKLQFASPQFAFVHGLWHLLPNAFLGMGKDILNRDVWSQTLQDLKEGSPLFDELKAAGAFPHILDKSGKTFDEVLKAAAPEAGVKQSYLRFLNPVGNHYIVNETLSKWDTMLRDMMIRNNLSKGFTIPEAIARTNKFMVNYQNLTTGEKASMRLFMPFYAWTKGNLGAQITGFMEHPWRQMLPGKVMDVLNQEFSGHNMVSNKAGKQQDIDLGQTPSGKEGYLSVPLGTKDLGAITNPLSFVGNRFGPVEKAGVVGLTGTDMGYPVVDSTSPTPDIVQRTAGMANAAGLNSLAQTFGLNAPTLEKNLAQIDMSTAQYPTKKPSLGDFGLSTIGLNRSESNSQAKQNATQQYLENKYLRSLRKRG